MKLKFFQRAGGALITLLLLFPGDGLAHAFPDHSEPRVGASLKSSPPMVKIFYDGAIEPLFSTIEVFDSNNKKVDKGDTQGDPNDKTVLEVSIPPLPPGKYEVSWSVVSIDTHRTEGRFKFTIEGK